MTLDSLFARFQPAGLMLGGPLTPMVRRLLWANGLVFLLEVILFLLPGGRQGYLAFVRWFGLVPFEVLGRGRVWQLATYMFLHEVTSLGHILWNMLSLWMFGTELERSWGGREFLRYYLITGVGAGLTVLALTPGLAAPTIGASGALFGLLLAYGMQFPNRVIYLYFLLPVRARWVAIFAGLVTLYFVVMAPGGGISYVAHLGGLVAGWLYLKRAWRIRQIVAEIRWHWRRRRFRIARERDDRDFRIH
jgi:membrane associated rhomboid family serine protease